MANKYLKATVLGVVDNQLKDNSPPATRLTFDRLKKAGYSEKDAKEKIAAIVLEEIYDVMKAQEPFNEKRFTMKLNSLT